MTATTSRPAPLRRRADWWVPLPLLVVSVIPALFGTLRLVEVLGGPRVMPDNPRITASPAPAVVHIVGGASFLLVGAFQLSTSIRIRWRNWHRRAGRALMLLGLAAAFSALWMTLLYPRQTGTGSVLHTSRVLFASGMAASIVLGYRAIRRHDRVQHRAWMMRAYALGLGAGTQTVTIGVGEGIFGKGVLATDLSTAAGWVINLALAEYLIRRPRRRRRQQQNRRRVPVPAT